MARLSIQEFADKLNEIIPTMMRELAKSQTNELMKGKISLPQFLLLEYLHRTQEAKMADLARFMRVSTAAMTGTVERLVRDHYVARAHEPQDRRVIKVKLTAKGEELVKKINQQRREMVIDIFSKISEAERRDYLRILNHVREVVAQKNPE